MTTSARTVLTIAGSDPSGGAGIQADLKTFAAFGLFGVSVVTALTAQNSVGVVRAASVEPSLVGQQIDGLTADLDIHAIKIGMLSNAAVVQVVARSIERCVIPIVLDPVIASSAGQRLLDNPGVEALRLTLFSRASVITPNIPEAEALSGCRITTLADRRRAARRLHEMGAGAVIITGGHQSADSVVDLLFDGRGFTELKVRRVPGPRVHGTGCTFAAAVACGLATQYDLSKAASRAQKYVAGAIAHALPIGHGALMLDHFWEGPPKGGPHD